MLTIQQVARLYENGVGVVMTRRLPAPIQRGEWNPSALEIIVFLRVVKKSQERDITLLHEAIHAVGDVLEGTKKLTEDEVEAQAIMTYNKKPYVLHFLKQLYGME